MHARTINGGFEVFFNKAGFQVGMNGRNWNWDFTHPLQAEGRYSNRVVPKEMTMEKENSVASREL